MGHRASGAVGQPGAAAWRSSLAGQPGGATCAHACADVGCIDCRIDAGRCVRVEVCWIDICGDARDAAIDVGCIEGCILAGCTDARFDVGGIDGCIVVGRFNVSMLVAFIVVLMSVSASASMFGCMDVCIDVACKG